MVNFTEVKPLRYWVQHILPLVYDDSLSYMELLGKVVNTLNEVVKNNNLLPDYITENIKEYISSGEIEKVLAEVLANYMLNVKFPPAGLTPATGDGSADDTEAIQGCIDYAYNHGGMAVYFPSGSYLTQPLTLRNKATLFGQDRYTTRLIMKGGSTKAMFTGDVDELTLTGLGFDGNMDIQVNNVNLFTISVNSAIITNCLLTDGYDLLNITVNNDLQLNNVIFKHAVENALVLNGDGFVQGDNLIFKTISALVGKNFVVVNVSNSILEQLKCHGASPNAVLINGNNNVVKIWNDLSTKAYTDNGTNNTIVVYTQSEQKKLTGFKTTNVSGNLSETVGSDKTETITGDKTETITGNKTEAITGDKNVNANNLIETMTGSCTRTVTGDINENAKNIKAVIQLAYDLTANTLTEHLTGKEVNATNFTENITNEKHLMAGSVTENITGDKQVNAANSTETIQGNKTITAGDISETTGNKTVHVTKNSTEQTDRKRTLIVKGANEETTGARTETVNGNKTSHVTGDSNETVDGNKIENVKGNNNETTTGTKELTAKTIFLNPKDPLKYGEIVKSQPFDYLTMQDKNGKGYKLLATHNENFELLPFLDVTKYGVLPNGEDMTDKLNALIEQYADNYTIYLKRGNYTFNGTINITKWATHFKCDGRIFSTADIAILLSATDCVIDIFQLYGNGSGVGFQNGNPDMTIAYGNSRLKFDFIYNFNTAIKFYANGNNGIQNNIVTLDRIDACDIGILFECGDTGTPWINQNTFHGGWISAAAAGASKPNGVGIKFVKGANQTDRFNGNVFNDFSCENTRYPIDIVYAWHNVFNHFRMIENTGSDLIKCGNDTEDNKFIGASTWVYYRDITDNGFFNHYWLTFHDETGSNICNESVFKDGVFIPVGEYFKTKSYTLTQAFSLPDDGWIDYVFFDGTNYNMILALSVKYSYILTANSFILETGTLAGFAHVQLYNGQIIAKSEDATGMSGVRLKANSKYLFIPVATNSWKVVPLNL